MDNHKEKRPMSAANEVRAKKLSIGGAVVAAIAASSCCIGPLILAALGIGGAGAFAALGAYRPYILGVTAALLAAGFYFTYRKPKAAVGDACGCEKPCPKAGRAGKIGLWTATGMVVVFAAAPNLLACLSRHGGHEQTVAITSGMAIEHAVIRVEGMDCEACATHIRGALAKADGFHDLSVDLKGRTITVAYESAPGRLQAYVAAINDIGYEASIPDKSAASRLTKRAVGLSD
jgi:copper chaperone CopZ